MKIIPALIAYLIFCVLLFALLRPIEGICGFPIGLIFFVMIAVLVFFGGIVAYFIIRSMSPQPTLPVQIAILIGCILGVILFIVGLSYLFSSVYS